MYDAKKFREVVEQNLKGRKKKEFAEECGISPSTLARYMSDKNPLRPSRSMLLGMSNHMDVSYEDLLTACGYESIPAFLQMDVKNRCLRNLEVMNEGFTTLCKSCRVYGNIRDFLQEYRMLYSEEDVEFEIGFKEEYEGSRYAYAEYFVPVIASFSFSGKECRTYFVLYFSETKGNRFIPLAYASDGRSLLEADVFSAKALESFMDEGEDPENMPYYYELRYLASDAQMAERLLKAIFGEEDESLHYMRSVPGFGFVLNDMPVHFMEFMRNHKDSFLTGSAEEKAYDALMNGQEEQALKEYCDDYTWSSGYGAFIGKVIREETGLDIHFFEGMDDSDNCLLVEEDSEDYRPRELKSMLFPYAKELGLSRFGACVTYVKSFLDSRDIYKL